MDEITKYWLEELAKRHPQKAITLSHQFLDGKKKHECGFVPHDWDGGKVYINVK